MSEFAEAFEGAVALIVGGFIFLLFASTIGANGFLNFGLWGLLFIALGVLGIVTVIAVGIGALLGGNR